MLVVGPAFFSSITGDHSPGDGLTRLQTVFEGSSSADISSYAIGSGGNNNGTVGDGYFEIVQDSAVFKALAYENAGLSRPNGEPQTIEFFFEAFETTANPPSACNMMQFDAQAGSIPTMKIKAFAGGINNVSWVALPTDEGFAEVTASPAADVFGSTHHVAFVIDTNGHLDIYYDGVRQLEGSLTLAGGESLGYVYLGGTGTGGGQQITIRYYGVRVRRAAMYSGASFTPLTGPEAWGAP